MNNLDLSLDVEDYKLNIRAAGIIIHGNKVLFHKNLKNNHYALVGGRVKLGEDSVTTIKREIMEEIGKEVEVIDEFATIENFFEVKGKKYHELMTAYRVEFVNKNDRKIEESLKCIEANKELEFEWLNIDRLNDYDIRPKAIKNVFSENKYPVHIINKEI